MPKVVSRASSLVEASSRPAAQRARGHRWPTDRFRLPVDRRTRTSGNTARTLTTSPPQCSRRQPERGSTRDRHDAPTQKPLSTPTKHSTSGNPRQHEPDGKSRRCSPQPEAPLGWSRGRTKALHSPDSSTEDGRRSRRHRGHDLVAPIGSSPVVSVRSGQTFSWCPRQAKALGDELGVAVSQELRAGRVARAPEPPAEAPDQTDGVAEARGWRQRARACERWRARATRHQRIAVRPGVQATSST